MYWLFLLLSLVLLGGRAIYVLTDSIIDSIIQFCPGIVIIGIYFILVKLFG